MDSTNLERPASVTVQRCPWHGYIYCDDTTAGKVVTRFWNHPSFHPDNVFFRDVPATATGLPHFPDLNLHFCITPKEKSVFFIRMKRQQGSTSVVDFPITCFPLPRSAATCACAPSSFRCGVLEVPYGQVVFKWCFHSAPGTWYRRGTPINVVHLVKKEVGLSPCGFTGL